MNILLSYIHYPVGAGKFLKKALREMGHTVVSVGPFTKGHLPWSTDDFSFYADRPDLGYEFPCDRVLDWKEVATYVYDSGAACRFDLVIQCDANFFIKDVPCPNVVWAIDNHVAKYDEVKFDRFFGAHSWGYGSTGANFQWLPCAYSPKDHYPVETEKQFDLMFLGVLYNHRASLLNLLAPHGKVAMGVGVLGKEYNIGYASSRMGFCLSACGDTPMRVFENAAQGLTVFCDKQKDLEKLGLADGVHYVGFSTGDEAVEKFKELVGNTEESQAIALCGQKALADHTYQARARELLGVL